MTIKKATKLRLENLIAVEPLTENQGKAFEFYSKGYNLVLNGSAGTGKTFLAMYLALEEVLDRESPYEHVMILRSTVQGRNQGFQPGDKNEKEEPFTPPYRAIASELFNVHDAWERLVAERHVAFESTSFNRGVTWHDTILVVDEMQNLSFHELDTAITRLGRNSKVIFCGDYYQSDLGRGEDKTGILDFLKVLERLTKYSTIQFTWSDIVRDEKVRDYIMTKEMMIKDGEIQKK